MENQKISSAKKVETIFKNEYAKSLYRLAIATEYASTKKIEIKNIENVVKKEKDLHQMVKNAWESFSQIFNQEFSALDVKTKD